MSETQNNQRALVLGYGDEIRSAERHSQGVNGHADDVGGDEDTDACSGSGCSTISEGVCVYRNSEREGKNKGCRGSNVGVRLREVYGSRPRLELQLLQLKRVVCKARGVRAGVGGGRVGVWAGGGRATDGVGRSG
jgi:hypothetical protein